MSVELANVSIYQNGAIVNSPLTNVESTVGADHRSVSANFGPVTLAAVTVPGMYQVNVYIVNTASGGGADAVGQLVVNYPDSSGGNAVYCTMPGTTSATILGNTVCSFYATTGNITYTLSSFVGATSLVMEVSATVTRI